MHAPDFWNDTSLPVPKSMSRLSKIYRFFSKRRIAARPSYISKIPVICVGNVVAGGSGKTPVVQAIAKLLLAHQKDPAIMLRGYHGTEKGPVWVTGQDAREIGDEALLHVAYAPTCVSRNRVKGAQFIETHSRCSHIIMDDGLQNPKLKKTVSLLVLDGSNPFGNGRLIPAGPLREPVDDAMKRSDAIIVLGDDKHHMTEKYGFLFPVFRAQLVPHVPKLFHGMALIAFAGIGNPDKFFTTLEKHGAILFDKIPFPDHHHYNESDLQDLLHKSQKANIPLVTTRKDWVRLPSKFQAHVQVLDVDLVWKDEAAFVRFMEEKHLV
jgi:tetraacyldisaccharide 4'-kinase